MVSGRISPFHFPFKRIYTKFRIPPKKDTGQPLYLLKRGAIHLKGDASKPEPKPVFLTSNTVTSTEKAEFDIRVYKNKVARVTPYSGSLTVEANINKLEETEINRWWDEIYR